MIRMRMATRRAMLAVSSAAMVVLQSCADGTPVAPRPALRSNQDLLSTTTQTLQSFTGLLSCKKLPDAYAAATIGKDGGRIDVGPHSLIVPAGALKDPVTITATAPSDKVNRVHFEPHGLTFSKPASLVMSYANCSTFGSLLGKHVDYVDGGLNILEILPSVDDLLAQKVTGTLQHFSDYAMGW